jgi:ParB family chromosome partitioning protein
MTADLARDVSRDTVPIALVDPDPDQPRRRFGTSEMAELAASLKANGMAVPILVRPYAGRYQLVHGERRWRAATSLGWSEIPAEIRELDDETARWLQLVENVNRADLSPVEEARAFRVMLDDGATQQTLAERIGKTRTYVAQKMRLLDLPASLSLLLDAGALSEGHVRQLLRIRGLYTPAHTCTAVAGAPMVDLGPVWKDTTTPQARANVAGLLLGSGRPEDWPPGFPLDLSGHPLVADAVEAMCREGAGSDTFPYWTLPATWFAATTITYALSVAELDKSIDSWIERLHAAVVEVEQVSRDTPKPAPGTLAWLGHWGHPSDLRHAGLLADHAHLTVAAIEAVQQAGSVVAPSGCQPWGPNHQEYDRLLDIERWSS